MITNYVLYTIFILVIFLSLKRLGKAMSSLGKSVEGLSESINRIDKSVRHLNRTMSFIVICIDLELIKSGSLNKDEEEKILRELLELTVVVYPAYFLMLYIGINPRVKALPPPESMTQKD